MFCHAEREERLVERRGFCRCAVARTCVRSESVTEYILAVILPILCGLSHERSERSMDQSEAESVVVRLFHAVLAVVEDRNAEGAVLCGEISPLMYAVLEVGETVGVAALFGAETEVE